MKRTKTWLKGYLAKRLRLSEDFVSDILNHPALREPVNMFLAGVDPPKEVLADARKIPEVVEAQRAAGRRPGRRKQAQPRDSLDPLDRRRAEVFSRQLGRLATPYAATFRKTFLGNRLLTDEEALQFFTSPALAVTDWETMHAYGVPVLDHAASMGSVDVFERDGSRVYEGSVTATWNRGVATYTVALYTKDPPEKNPFRELAFKNPKSLSAHVRSVIVWPDSVLDVLRRLSLSLSERFPWRPEHAAFFVLTGVAPVLSALSMSFTRYPLKVTSTQGYAFSPVTINVLPWVDADRVEAAFRRAQRQLLGSNKRLIGIRALDVFDFVMERRTRKPRATFASLRQKWNKIHKDDGFPSTSAFTLTFKRAQKSVLLMLGSRPEKPPASEAFEDIPEQQEPTARARGVRGRGRH